ncbi:Nucleolar complex protein 3 [Portunus trituberculatus]|uniref:Nucleolar complex protein 3 n=1 Tax=Portunus trituberculatus TaxID=210409 RepID=A0A5B7CPG8_PORTR|nr:Nucleolar complex protein 3 [Portunus trituberculatus]
METDVEGTSGVFSAEVEEPEHSNAGASTFWEFHLLSRHYHSTVQQLATHLLAGVPLQGDKTLPYTLTKRSVYELFEEYNSSEMRFKPPVPPPGQHLTNQVCSRTKKRKRGNRDHYVTDFMFTQVETLKSPLVNGHTKDKINGIPKVNGFTENVGYSGEFPCVNVQDVDFSSGMLANMELKRIKVREREEEAASRAVTVSLVKVESKA